MYASLLVRGKVQGVGYRYFVRTKAKKLGIKGIVRNKSDGSVEIFAECNSEEHLKRFVDEISNKDSSSNAVVSSIEVFKEGEANFKKPWKDYYNDFVIDYSKAE